MKDSKDYGLAIIAIMFIIIQFALFTNYQVLFGKLDSAILMMVCGLLPACIIFFRSKPSGFSQPTWHQGKTLSAKFILLGLFAIWSFILIVLNLNLWNQYPLHMDEVGFSDIYPQVHILVNRFMQGESVYTPIEFPGYTLFPTYLPATWGPFLLTEWLSIDYRWLPLIVCLGSIFMYLVHLLKLDVPIWMAMLLGSLPLLGWMLYLHAFPKEAAHNLEPMIAGFYMLLFLSFFSQSVWFKIIALMLCLLSRYSVVLWIPLYILVMYTSAPKQARTMLLSGILILFLFYILPFLIKDPGIFLNGYRYHETAAIEEWMKTPPEHLEKGIGLALFFYRFAPGEIDQKLDLLQQVHLFTSLLSVLLMGIFYWLKRPNTPNFLAASLLIYLTLFYSLIQIPYTYLFVTPILLGSLLPLTFFQRFSRRLPVR
jgi:hypothetical protein